MRNVYEKYKHLDYLLSDPEWLEDNVMSKILHDLWICLKEDQKIWDFYDSVSCLYVEGVEFMDHEEIYQAIKAAWEKTL